MRLGWVVVVSALVASSTWLACTSSTGNDKTPAADAGSEAGAGGDAATACSDTQKSCGSTCVSLFDPTTGCASDVCTPCAPGANGVPSCRAGACHLSCNPGFGDCDGNPANGCETPTSSDAKNCGACGNTCDGGPCTGGKC